ncbi:unnamed protein product [Malus baccata var. baccata]
MKIPKKARSSGDEIELIFLVRSLEYFHCMLRVNCLPILGAAIPRLIDRRIILFLYQRFIHDHIFMCAGSLIGGDPEQQFAMCCECLQIAKNIRVCVSKMWRQKVFKSNIQFSHLHCILVDALVDLKEIKHAGDW